MSICLLIKAQKSAEYVFIHLGQWQLLKQSRTIVTNSLIIAIIISSYSIICLKHNIQFQVSSFHDETCFQIKLSRRVLFTQKILFHTLLFIFIGKGMLLSYQIAK